MPLNQYVLYKPGSKEQAEVITLTNLQYDEVRNGYGDYRLKPVDQKQ